MEKRLVAIIFILIGLIVAGCNDADNSKESNVNTTSMETEQTGTGPLIDVGNAINERDEIVTMVEEQKEMLKLGFITEETSVDGLFLNRYTDSELAEKDQLNYASSYRGKEDPSVSYSNEPWVCEDGMDEWTNDLGDREYFKDDRLEGYYGHIEYDSKSLVVKYNDRCYSTFISTDDGYDEKDKRFLELMSKTFKTEAEGAYDPIYNRFTMDLNKIKFPSLNPNRAVLRDTYLGYYESRSDPSYSVVGAGYFISDEFIMYEITDEEEPYATIASEEELQTENGVNAKKFTEEKGNQLMYLWKDDHYNYLIKVYEGTELPDSDLLEIIDSAMEDKRSFDNLDFFHSVTEKSELGEYELEINENYY